MTVAGPSEVSSLARRLNELAVAVRREQEAYRVVFEGSPLPMWVHETESRRILEVNDAAVAGYGYPRDELVGMSVDRSNGPRPSTCAATARRSSSASRRTRSTSAAARRPS